MLLLLVGKYVRDKIVFLFKKSFLCFFFLSEWQRDGERRCKDAAAAGAGGEIPQKQKKFVILFKNLMYVFLVSEGRRDKERDWKDAAAAGGEIS